MMNPSFSRRLWMTALMILSCAGASAAGSASAPSIDRSFSVSSGGKLIIHADRGSISVEPGDTSQVTVHIERQVRWGGGRRTEDLLANHKIAFDQQGNTVTVTASFEGEHWWQRARSFDVKYTVTTPRQFDLELRTSGGRIAVTDLAGQMVARTSGGSIHLGTIDGPVTAHTSGGGIHLSRGKGKLELETSGGGIVVGGGEGWLRAKSSGGSISLEGFNGDATVRTSGGAIRTEKVAGTLQAHTSGGSIHATFIEAPRGKCQLETSGGGISVRLPAQSKVDLDAQTSGGHVRSNLPVLVDGTQHRNALKGAVNGGGVSLVLRTSGGSIQVEKL